MGNISLLLSCLSGFSAFIGSFIIFFKFKRVEELIVFCLSFSLGIMINVSIFELIPSSYIVINKSFGYIYGNVLFILIFIFGILSLLVINDLLNEDNKLKRIGVLNFISLMIHNIPEGIIVYMSSFIDINLGIKMCLSIMLHNIPEGISIAVPLFYSNSDRGSALFLTFISGFAEFLGAFICHIFLKKFINNIIISFMQIFVAGFMISLAIFKLSKELTIYNKSKYVLMGISSSCFVSLIITFI